MTEDIELDYDYMMQKALRVLVRDVLTLVAELGDAPGEHHFYIEFLTRAAGVSIPERLSSEYPERMTIVLQHQFESLDVTDDGFGVTLWFSGKEARLEIPYSAVTSFADPSVQFGVRFEDAALEDSQLTPASQTTEAEAGTEAAPSDDTKPEDDAAEKSGDGAEVVSLDAFRKK